MRDIQISLFLNKTVWNSLTIVKFTIQILSDILRFHMPVFKWNLDQIIQGMCKIMNNSYLLFHAFHSFNFTFSFSHFTFKFKLWFWFVWIILFDSGLFAKFKTLYWIQDNSSLARKWLMGCGKESHPRFWTAPINFS